LPGVAGSPSGEPAGVVADTRVVSVQRPHTVPVSDRKLRSGGRAHELTTADRRKGAKRTNEIKRARRDEAEQAARHMLAAAAGDAGPHRAPQQRVTATRRDWRYRVVRGGAG
jgi:hypothetical protein